MGDVSYISIGFELWMMNVPLGHIRVTRAGVSGGGEKVRGWLPFGPWDWKKMGNYPPVPEYWLQQRFGGWSWQLLSPTQSHILLTHDDKVIGAVANFNKQDFEKGKGYMDGDWIIEYDNWKGGGRWVMTSISYV